MNLFSYFGSSIKYYRDQQGQMKVLIFGGVATIEKAQGANKAKFCSSEIKILNLQTMEWHDSMKIKSDIVTGRKHCAADLVSNSFYI